jgi:colanic acid biosynthesis glycosyl transferase WcaI
MNVCMWLGGSLEEWCSSYHLLTELAKAIIHSDHKVYMIQAQRSTGAIPAELQKLPEMHTINVPQKETKKGNFVTRYIREYEHFKKSGEKLKELHKKVGIDVVFLQSNNIAIVPVNICRKLHIPVIYNVQDVFPIDALAVGKLSAHHPAFFVSRKLQTLAYKRADRVVTISEDLKKTIQGEGRKGVDVIYNWSYRNEPYRIDEADNHFLLSNKIKRTDGFRVVYAGNVGQMMDAEMIVRVAVRLKEKKDIKFFIIGEGSGLKRLKEKVELERLTNILFYPRQPMEYAQDNYCMADVNINPVPKGVMYTCMPSKTATCLLSEKPTVVSMDLDSDMAKRLSTVDQWSVVAPEDDKAMAEAILKIYEVWKSGKSRKSRDAGEFLGKLGPVENAYKYVEILEEAAYEASRSD